MTTAQQGSQLEPCPLNHHVSAGLRVNKTDPKILCLDCGLTLAATDWATLYERWNTRRAAVAGPRGDAISREEVVARIERQIRLWNNDTVTMACADMLAEIKQLGATDAATSSPTPAESVNPVAHPFGPCGYRYCDWPDGELRCNEPRSGEASNVAR